MQPWTLITAVLNLGLVQAWSPNQTVFFSFNGLSWFLSALLFCYFMAPPMLHWARTVKRASIAFCAVFLLRYAMEWMQQVWPDTLYAYNVHVFPPVRCLEFWMGMLICPLALALKAKYGAWRAQHTKASFVLVSFAEVAAACLTVYWAIEKNAVWLRAQFVLLFCGLVLVLIVGENGILSRVLSLRLFQAFSKVQFEFYMLHIVVLNTIDPLLAMVWPSWQIHCTISFLCTICIGYLYSRFIKHYLTAGLNRLAGCVYTAVAE